MIVIAKESFVHVAGDVRDEVHKGDQRSDTHPTVLAQPDRFTAADPAYIGKVTREARPDSDRRHYL
jgi:hypothetical protein